MISKKFTNINNAYYYFMYYEIITYKLVWVIRFC